MDLCRSLGMRVVAEGVETGEVWSALHCLGCDHAQGYWVSRPVPADAFDVVANRLVAAERPV
ncbi:MAG: EAL domain-containing protein [Actinomycetota bacterium]